MTRGAELQLIVREGKRIRTKHLEVRAAASPHARPAGSRTRIGLVVPRFRHTAVARNRLKRRLRELARHRMLPSDVAADIVIRVRPEAYAASFTDLAGEVNHAVAQLARWRATVMEPDAELLPCQPGMQLGDSQPPASEPRASEASDT